MSPHRLLAKAVHRHHLHDLFNVAVVNGPGAREEKADPGPGKRKFRGDDHQEGANERYEEQIGIPKYYSKIYLRKGRARERFVERRRKQFSSCA